ncbi:MAG TPA: zinc ribbon domain-containing protein [Blastocatellia bacterium]|nr:zinc ribbon domain-containing protein [Blastocatellia bacterium]
MFCPKCATGNVDDAKFCRSCGANLSLVPQAMTGRLPESRHTRRRNRHGRDYEGTPNLARGIMQFMMGLGFLVVAAAIFFTAPGGRGWWWAMLFPAFSLMGGGIARMVGAITATPRVQSGPAQTVMPPAPQTGELPPQQAYNPLPPPSVTEGTTRHLDPAKDRYDEKR